LAERPYSSFGLRRTQFTLDPQRRLRWSGS
jgi:hypothetical protein